MFKKTLLLCLLPMDLLWAQENTGSKFAGYWEGQLHVTKTDSLTFGIYIEQQNDSISIEFDSPDQYVLGIEGTLKEMTDSSLICSASSINARFKGKLSSNEDTLSGVFFQNSAKNPLILTKGHERRIFNRPQEPQPPYPYSEEEISIRRPSQPFNLISGTLTMPQDAPRSLVILISGSGWQDRDETLFGHRPFKVIADCLSRQSHAVFRYDDLPMAIFAKSTTYDFKDAVELIIDSLSARPGLRGLPIGLAGHSEGAMVAFMTAAEDTRVGFIISLSGVAQTMKEVLDYQIRAMARADDRLSQAQTDSSLLISNMMYDIVIKAKTPEKAAAKMSAKWDEIARKMPAKERELYNMTPRSKLQSIRTMCSPWYFQLLKIKPKAYMKKIGCPVLAIGGSKDLQVEAGPNFALMRKYLPQNPHHRYVLIEAGNHPLQICQTGSVEEYGRIEQTIAPEVLHEMKNWIEEVITDKKANKNTIKQHHLKK